MDAIDFSDLPPRLQKLDRVFKAVATPDVEYKGILTGPAGSFAVLLQRPGAEKAEIAMSRDVQRRRLGNYRYARQIIKEFRERKAQTQA